MVEKDGINTGSVRVHLTGDSRTPRRADLQSGMCDCMSLELKNIIILYCMFFDVDKMNFLLVLMLSPHLIWCVVTYK